MPHLFDKLHHSKKAKKKGEEEPDYEVVQQLGQGGFAVVQQVRRKGAQAGLDVALRICPLQPAIDSCQTKSVEELKMRMDFAIKAIDEVNSPHLMRIFSYKMTDKDFFVFNELLAGGDMFDRVTGTEPGGHFSEEDARDAARNLCGAFALMHKYKTLHRDIKPENVMYRKKTSPNAEVVIVDYGCTAHPVGPDDLLYDMAGTPGALAGFFATTGLSIERLHGARGKMLLGTGYGQPADCFSFGISVFRDLERLRVELSPLTGLRDVHGSLSASWRNARADVRISTLYRICIAILPSATETINRKIPFPPSYWKKMSPEAMDFVRGFLKKDPRERMSFAEGLEHAVRPWTEARARLVMAAQWLQEGGRHARRDSTASTASSVDHTDHSAPLSLRKTMTQHMSAAAMANPLAAVLGNKVVSKSPSGQHVTEVPLDAVLAGDLEPAQMLKLQSLSLSDSSEETSVPEPLEVKTES